MPTKLARLTCQRYLPCVCEFRVLPQIAVLLHVVGRSLRNGTTVITLAYMQSEMDARRKSGRGRYPVVFNVPQSLDEVDSRITLLDPVLVQMMGGGVFSVEHAISREHGGAGAHRHGHIRSFSVGQEP